MCSRGHWRPAEDEKLRELVERYGPHNWNAIAEKLRGRSGERIMPCILSSCSSSFCLQQLFIHSNQLPILLQKNDLGKYEKSAQPNSFSFVVASDYSSIIKLYYWY